MIMGDKLKQSDKLFGTPYGVIRDIFNASVEYFGDQKDEKSERELRILYARLDINHNRKYAELPWVLFFFRFLNEYMIKK
jgi:hypothetical protein